MSDADWADHSLTMARLAIKEKTGIKSEYQQEALALEEIVNSGTFAAMSAGSKDWIVFRIEGELMSIAMGPMWRRSTKEGCTDVKAAERLLTLLDQVTTPQRKRDIIVRVAETHETCEGWLANGGRRRR